jgi:hypothetical protein
MIEMTFEKKDLDALKSKLNKISLKNHDNVLKKAFTDGTIEIERQLKSNISGRFLKVRTGLLRNSIGSKVYENEGELLGIIGSGVRTGERVKYASILETGGTIFPVIAKFLTIPLSGALTPAGVSRGPARSFSNTFISKNIIFQKQGNKVVPLFILKKSVKIPAFRYMQRTVDEVQDKIFSIISNSVQKALEGNA